MSIPACPPNAEPVTTSRPVRVAKRIAALRVFQIFIIFLHMFSNKKADSTPVGDISCRPILQPVYFCNRSLRFV
jgi:hypothetical protein